MLPQPIKVFFGLRLGKQWGLSKSDTTNRTITFPVSVATPLAIILTGARHDGANIYVAVRGSGSSVNNLTPALTANNVMITNEHNTAAYWLLIAKA